MPPSSVTTVEIRKKPTWIQNDAVSAFKTDGNAVSLKRSEQNSTVPRVLVDDLPALLAFLLEVLERRNNRRHQLYNDGGRNVRHDAQGKDRHTLNGAACKHVEQTKNTPGLSFECLCIGFRIKARKWDMCPKTIDKKRSQRKPQALLQVRCLRESRKVQIRGQLLSCRCHAYLRLTSSAGQTGSRQKAVSFPISENREMEGAETNLDAPPHFPLHPG